MVASITLLGTVHSAATPSSVSLNLKTTMELDPFGDRNV